MAKKNITPQQHYDACVLLYEKNGATAVYDYAKKHNIEHWTYCEPCDTDTPHVSVDSKGTCLVCGSGYPDMNRIELVLWEDVRAAMKYPKEDNNKGFTYGINLMDDANEIISVQWFKTAGARQGFIKQNKLRVVYGT